MESILHQADWYAAVVFVVGVLTRITLALLSCYCVARMLPRHATLRHAVLLAGLLSVLAMPFLGGSHLRVKLPRISLNLPLEHSPVTSSDTVESSYQPYHVQESDDSSLSDAKSVSSTASNGSKRVFGLSLFIATWAIVSGVRTIGLVRSFIHLRHLVKHSSVADCRQLQLLVEEFRMRFRFKRKIVILTSAQITNPLSVGMVRNCVVLPRGLADSLSSVELKAVMFHEMAHLQRRDHVVLLLQEIVGTLLWWHPLALLVNRELTRAREEVCDNYVLQTADAEAYSEALLTISRILFPATETVGATPLWGSRWNLENRVSSILDERRIVMTSLNLRTSVTVTTLCLAISFALATTGFSHDAGHEKQRFEGSRDFSDTDMHRIRSMTDLQVLSLENTKVTDAGLNHLAELTNLENLNLSGTDVTDDGLAHLKTLTNLKSLALSGTKVTSAGMENLKDLKNLTELYLFDTAVTDDGLKHLESLTNLTILNLARTKITDAGVKHLQQMKKLQNLFLGFTGVTDTGLPYLAGMKDLRGVFLVRTDVSGQGLKHIKDLTKLESLWLSYTNATDSGLVHLKGLTNLKHLNLSGTRITDSGLAYLGGLSNLETLHLSLTRVDSLDRLNGLRNLRSLYAIHSAVSETAIDELQQELPNLTIHD